MTTTSAPAPAALTPGRYSPDLLTRVNLGELGPLTLDGRPARLIAHGPTEHPALFVSDRSSNLTIPTDWETVLRTMNTGGDFRSNR